jgi:hypothetical protein
VEGNENKKEATQGRLGFPGPQKEASFSSGPSRNFPLFYFIREGNHYKDKEVIWWVKTNCNEDIHAEAC